MPHLTLILEIPEPLPNDSPEETAQRYLQPAIAKWYELGLISQSRGAELAGLSREDFLTLLAKYGVSPIQVDPKDSHF